MGLSLEQVRPRRTEEDGDRDFTVVELLTSSSWECWSAIVVLAVSSVSASSGQASGIAD